MNLLVFGAAGLTGRELVTQGLAGGHRITAFVRDPARLTIDDDRLHIVRGDVTDPDDVTSAIDGQHAALCALGGRTPMRRDLTLVGGVENIIAAMTATRVQRLVYLSFLGVPDGRWQLSVLGRRIVAPIVLHNVSADHAVKESLMMNSALEWTIVRPPRLTNGTKTGRYRHGTEIRAESMVPTLSRADLAEFMLGALDDPRYLRKAPAVMY